jgi:hypothetical protein
MRARRRAASGAGGGEPATSRSGAGGDEPATSRSGAGGAAADTEQASREAATSDAAHARSGAAARAGEGVELWNFPLGFFFFSFLLSRIGISVGSVETEKSK